MRVRIGEQVKMQGADLFGRVVSITVYSVTVQWAEEPSTYSKKHFQDLVDTGRIILIRD